MTTTKDKWRLGMVLHYFCSGKYFEKGHLVMLYHQVESLHCCCLPDGYELRLLLLGVSPLLFSASPQVYLTLVT